MARYKERYGLNLKSLAPKRFFAELIGTALLVASGCGAAMLFGARAGSGGYLLTALVFGFTYMGLFYFAGPVSGCHLNPAVSVGVFMTGEMGVGEFFGYLLCQFAGAFAGTEFLSLLFRLSGYVDLTGDFFSNTTKSAGVSASFIAEFVFTAAFCLVAISAIIRRNAHPSGGIATGFALCGMYLLGMAFTNASLNPARSLAPALTCVIAKNNAPISEIWVFILAPILGGAVAAGIYKAAELPDKS